MKLRTALITATAIAIPTLAIGGLTRALTETPTYKVTEKKSGFEVREYPTMAVVSTKMSPSADRETQDARFMRLFRYIDKGNAKQQKIAMTTPVFMESGGKSGAMSFVIPKKVSQSGAPQPQSENVYLGTITGGKYAALRFRGARSGAAEKQAVEKLRSALQAAKVKVAAGDPIFAYYDPPWTPKALRRNEVLIRLK